MRFISCGIPLLLFVPLTVDSSESAYTTTEVANGGTIRGTVTWVGNQVAPPDTIQIDKDQAICGAFKLSETLIVDSASKGVMNAVVEIVDITAGKPFEAVAAPVISQESCVYVPHVQVFLPPASLTIRNNDDLFHNIHAFAGQVSMFNVSQPSYIKKWPVRLVEPARIVDIQCDVHPWMMAYLYPVKNPYFAITGADGSFEITDVPPGEHLLSLINSRILGIESSSPLKTSS
jgi:hypothetical protein